jgi:hypothetical protein
MWLWNSIVRLFWIGLSLLLVVGVLSGLPSLFEREGTFETKYCAEKIDVTNSLWQRGWHTFTCDLTKTNRGKVLYGTCARLEWSSGTCTAAYSYTKKSEVRCWPGSHGTMGDQCECDYGKVWNTSKTACIDSSSGPPQ